MINKNLYRALVLFACGAICGCACILLGAWCPMYEAKADRIIAGIGTTNEKLDLLIYLMEKDRQIKRIVEVG